MEIDVYPLSRAPGDRCRWLGHISKLAHASGLEILFIKKNTPFVFAKSRQKTSE
jgi:hypothetical protein